MTQDPDPGSHDPDPMTQDPQDPRIPGIQDRFGRGSWQMLARFAGQHTWLFWA